MSASEKWLDINIACLGLVLHFREHGIEIVGAEMVGSDILRLVLKSDDLPDGPVVAIYQRHEDGRTTLKSMKPA